MSADPSDDEEQRWAYLRDEVKVLVQETLSYIVFIDGSDDVDWVTAPEWDAAGPGDSARHSAVLNGAAVVETTPCESLPASVKLQFKRLIAEAYARSFEHDYAAADAMLGAARDYVRVRSEEVARGWYLTASLASAAIALTFALIVWLLRPWASVFLGANGVWLVMSGGCGALGALLSVIVRSGKLQVDCAAGIYLHRLEGVSRILAGVSTGFLAALAVMSGLIFSSLLKGGHLAPGILLASFAAGTTERFASSIIARISPEHDAVDHRKPDRKELPHDS